MHLFLSPHNDDEALFGAFTLIRERPLVVVLTDSWVQYNRGDGITADQRWHETCSALAVLGCPGFRLGLRDDGLTTDGLLAALALFTGVTRVYAPARQGGHKHHDLVHDAARRLFAIERGVPVIEYCTYSKAKQSYANEGRISIDGTEEEWRLKIAALACYPSQFPRSQHHFNAVLKKPEWIS